MSEETVRVWLVERTYSDDEQNIVITTYATPDGERYHRRERALTSFTSGETGTRVALDVPLADLGTTSADDRKRYAAEAARVAENHDPDDRV